MNLNNINISDRKQKEMLNKVEDFVDTVRPKKFKLVKIVLIVF